MAEAPTPPSDEESRKKTLGHLEYFEREKLIQAGKFIAEHGAGEIADGDVIVTHGVSHHVVEILLAAFDAGKTFRVVVVDSRPKLEGRETLKRLLGRGIPCAYTTLAGLGYVLRKGGATKTLVGAAAVLANGAVVSRVGTAVVAAASTHRGVPVLVAAETCKFHERVQVDAIASNELGNQAEIVDVGSGSGGSGGNGGGGGGWRGGGVAGFAAARVGGRGTAERSQLALRRDARGVREEHRVRERSGRPCGRPVVLAVTDAASAPSCSLSSATSY